jgi:hypothetical protein
VITLDTGPEVDTAEVSPDKNIEDWPTVEAIPFMDATSEVATPVVSNVEFTVGTVKIDVPSPSEVSNEVASEEELQIEEGVVVVIFDEAPSDGVLVGAGGVLVMFVDSAISVIAVSLHTDDASLEVTAPEVIALLQVVVGDSVGILSTPEIGGELAGWPSEGAGKELQIDVCPVVGPVD